MILTQTLPSLFNRPDLHTRMAPRRRLPHPTSTTTSSTLHNGFEPLPPLIPTYSQFLGTFEEEPPRSSGLFQPPDLPSYPDTSSYNFDPFAPGPSRPQRSLSPEYMQDPNVIVQGGWITDVFGKLQYVGHGKIEEVEDDVDPVIASNHSGDDEDNLATKRARSAVQRPSQAGNHESTDDIYEEDFALISTPPPCPQPRKLPSLRAHSTASDSFYYTATKVPLALTATANMDLPGGASTSNPAVPDDPNEVLLVTENLNLLNSSQEAVRFLNTVRLGPHSSFVLNQIDVLNSELDLSRHIDISSQLEEYLETLRRTLILRTQIGAEEWNVRSSSWNQKYCRRLLSLRTTLQRLTRMTQLIEDNQTLRPRQRLVILTKLEQHEAKLADLASKYSTAFDRLRLRHLHFLLTQSHMEAKRQKAQKSRLTSRVSFERRWQEGKNLRAGLRHAFHDLRQEFYNSTPRPGRNTSAL